MLRYNRVVPEGIELTVESGGFFHPFNTPGGTPVTGLRPEDHRWHRGIFFAWIEMLGEQSADFWGWGRFAPVENRRIVSRAISDVRAEDDGARFVAENDWIAGDAVMLRERLQVFARRMEGVNVLDLAYTLTPTGDLTIPQRAFGGFCFRTRIDGEIQPFSREGPVELSPPEALDPESNWPPQPWYALMIQLSEDESVVGAAVIDHPDNPESTWHNAFGIGMLNPTIAAPGEVRLEAGESFTLRYRAVTFDGPVPAALLDRLAAEWGH
jgi:hypothetical protein